MYRRTFLTTLGAALAAPAAAFGHHDKADANPHPNAEVFPHDYYPHDARPYFHPGDLTYDRVDPEIWHVVKRINQSGWVWTVESCQGHPDQEHPWSKDPLIRLVTQHGNADRMFSYLHRSAILVPNELDPTLPGPCNKIEVYRQVAPPLPGWYETRVVVRGPKPIDVFFRFANLICEAGVR